MAQSRGYIMKLSVPIYSLKRLAKSISRKENIPLHAALDKVAKSEGFDNWSLLAARTTTNASATEIMGLLTSGEIVLLGARPGQGKTQLGVDLVAKSAKTGTHGWFFTLEWNKADVEEQLNYLGEANLTTNDHFHFDGSDLISADYIIDQMVNAQPGTVVVIDYLQLLDQKRTNPDLSKQVSKLKAFAKQFGVIIVCISQIDRSYENSNKQTPTLDDVRLPNPLDLALFDRACFLHDGDIVHAHL